MMIDPQTSPSTSKESTSAENASADPESTHVVNDSAALPEMPIVLDHDPVMDTIVISDLHLGSSVSRGKRLLELLHALTYRRLILNGDVFDDLNFKRLTKDDWRFLSYIRKMSNPKRGIEVVWVIGNHDGGVAEILSHLLGVPVHDEYVWQAGSLRCLAIHGHQFDKWITEHVIVTAIASTLYEWLQRLDPEHRVSRWVKRTSKKWLRLSDKVAHDAVEYGRKHHGADVVFCGHTHHFTDRVVGSGRYINSGCWTDKPSQYVTITSAGEITVRQCS